ncbi:glyceraldehyde 3-phosphate dehydrogenase NAD-binding domain-containing protein [Phaeobacter sp. QD34_3]|uniref:type I glyceraldehyde-3-phosphate dehydrogenase n=1 Tax=unclassified Phaeobacter TaxID=2621772 RepID=UPI00237FC591|nr:MULTISPECIES: glyceraldehyde 3-phosphate dehydrogenase NAD-binding domain-containing protein [unclassified Phaeobacter]MDE4131518.1 glyceraldehyde 3-phosphate dehydrogenase NAD-binding domain-containing protein [Phaeobacter sp. QD34_3]MDE4135393.1 glyceraldehyde 3-phosphate dehydrogenase NAD-binding domain-containing protein [Phaeobacter sp. QD34_24]
MKIAINGFGRIGRAILRQILMQPGHEDIEVLRINDIAPLDLCAYLLQYDSTYGPLPGTVETDAVKTGTGATGTGSLRVMGREIPVSQCADLTEVDLSGVDVVLECTGIARTSDVAQRGLEAGARKVLISGPSPAAERTIVLGANEDSLGAARVVSNASCTTNALAPLVKLLDGIGGIETAHMTTIHCYTNSQPLVDAPRGDFARSRAAAMSMVPTTTSAMHLIDEVLPHLQGRISGAAVRVPTASVSAVDLIAQLKAPLCEETLLARLKEAVSHCPQLGWTDLPLVSSDLRARPESLVLAAPETRICGERQIRLFGWYDNEWGFSARMLDVARLMAAT